MALEGTHIRLAIDLESDLGVANARPYVAGAVYPDSRYLTGIARHVTHDHAFLEPSFYGQDDFRKGWAAHLACDCAMAVVYDRLFRRELGRPSHGMRQGGDRWITKSALKILQDIHDVSHFDIRAHLPALEHVECPNGEDEAVMRAYHRIFMNMYRDGRSSLERSIDMWLKLTGDTEAVAKIRREVETLQVSRGVMKRIRGAYDEILEEARPLLGL